MQRGPAGGWPVWSAVAAQAAVLAATASSYGYHRDELYFRMLPPAWGYRDQPPLTPLLARVSTDVVGDTVLALRVPAIILSAVAVLLIAAIAREVGAGRVGQGLAAWGYAFGVFPLIVGHTLLTNSVDAVIWAAILLLTIRALLRGEERWWLLAGLVTGIGLLSKILVVVLLAAIAIGLLVTGAGRVLRSRGVLLGLLVGVVVGAPTIVYQLTHGLPQLAVGAALSQENAGEVRIAMWWMLPVLLGPPLTFILWRGLQQAWRREEWRSLRFIVPTVGLVIVATFVMGSQPTYPFGVLGPAYALGCAVIGAGLTRPFRDQVVALALNSVLCAVVALPLIPLGWLGATPVPALNQVARDSVGWPTYVDQISRVAADERHEVGAIITSNYGEAGALDRFGEGLPPVRSGHNALWELGPPPATAYTVVVVGGQLDSVRGLFRSCEVRDRLDNGVGVDSEEQGQPIAVCTDPAGGWDAVWPRFRHDS